MHKKKITLIDDDVQSNQLLKGVLEDTGFYEITVENSPTRAMDTLRSSKPDLVFLDVNMPHISGGEIASQMKDDDALKKIPLVFLTANVTEEEVKAHQGLIGGYPFIAKPVNSKAIIAAIEKYTS